MGLGCGFFGMHPRCRGFFKSVQSDWTEENEFSPCYIRNRSGSGVTPADVMDLLENYLSVTDFSLFLDGYNTKVLADYNFRYGVNEVTTLSGLPVSRGSVAASLSGNSTLILSGAMLPGQVINIQATATEPLTVTLPSSAGWTLMDDAALDLAAGDVAEINVWCTGENKYSVKTSVGG